ncbi:MAG: DUF393 domain-containing protein [Fibromonadales bacterium]|nr:DUF393 domain-containing protein [Fibromonadales bacterium]
MKLYFDHNCPVCRSYAKLLQKHLSGEVETIPLQDGEQAREFKLELSSGEVLYGKEAIDALVKEVPKVKDFFWMLPDSYRGKAIYKTYALGRFMRRVFNFFSRRQCEECGYSQNISP